MISKCNNKVIPCIQQWSSVLVQDVTKGLPEEYFNVMKWSVLLTTRGFNLVADCFFFYCITCILSLDGAVTWIFTNNHYLQLPTSLKEKEKEWQRFRVLYIQMLSSTYEDNYPHHTELIFWPWAKTIRQMSIICIQKRPPLESAGALE